MINRFTDDQIRDLCALIGEVIDVDDCGVSRESCAVIFADAAVSALAAPESAEPAFLPFAQNLARIANRVPA